MYKRFTYTQHVRKKRISGAAKSVFPTENTGENIYDLFYYQLSK